MDERGHLAAKFNNSKLTRIAHRKPPPKAPADPKGNNAATDQKYALLFYITPFQMGNLSKVGGGELIRTFLNLIFVTFRRSNSMCGPYLFP